MTPAEKRLKELIDRWLASLDLHLQYVELKDSAYNNVQPWPVHDRPTRWVLELAKQKTLELQAAFESRLAMGDGKFAESMELMVFLATLVGIQHVQRYIPLADPERHGQGTLTEHDGLKPVVTAATKAAQTASGKTTVEPTVALPRPPATPKPAAAPAAPATQAHQSSTVASKAASTVAPTAALKVAPPNVPVLHADAEATREMPRPQRTASPAPPATVDNKPQPATQAATPVATNASIQALSETHNLVINDAVRLLNWGRPWHELAELIARIADRPKLPEVRRILRSHRAAIEMRIADAQADKDEKQSKEGK